MKKQKFLYNIFTFFMVFLCIGVNSYAQYQNIKVLPRPTNPYTAVNDFAQTMSPLQVKSLENKLRQFYDSTSNEIIIITLNDLGGYEAEDVAYAYGKAWKPGNKAKDNAVIILLSLNPRKLRFEVGKGLEGALPDGLAGTIQRRDMVPLLANKNYAAAFEVGVNSIIAATRSEYKMDDLSDRRDSGKQGNGLFGLLVVFVILLILLYFIKKGGGGNGGMLSRRGYRRWQGPTVIDYGPWGGNSGGGIFGGNSGGGNDSWGDFGGFGGGDFGGGGATSDW